MKSRFTFHDHSLNSWRSLEISPIKYSLKKINREQAWKQDSFTEKQNGEQICHFVEAKYIIALKILEI